MSPCSGLSKLGPYGPIVSDGDGSCDERIMDVKPSGNEDYDEVGRPGGKRLRIDHEERKSHLRVKSVNGYAELVKSIDDIRRFFR